MNEVEIFDSCSSLINVGVFSQNTLSSAKKNYNSWVNKCFEAQVTIHNLLRRF